MSILRKVEYYFSTYTTNTNGLRKKMQVILNNSYFTLCPYLYILVNSKP